MVQVKGKRPFGSQDKKSEVSHKHLVNGTIKAQQLRVITSTGENLGVVSRAAALQKAEEEGLDLVQVSGDSTSEVVIAKIMDFGKFLYEKKKQDVKAKKHQKVIQIKELKLRPYIEEQDYRIKLKQSAQFLEDGKRVKFTLQFRRGRELINMNALGSALFARIDADLAALSLGVILEEKEQRGRILWSKVYYLKGK
ncbi:MAG: translation initiation factor [Candidatus Dependentiae bacterium]|nr:translation initiation factor [Candidatus Dependentiae bacterium]